MPHTRTLTDMHTPHKRTDGASGFSPFFYILFSTRWFLLNPVFTSPPSASLKLSHSHLPPGFSLFSHSGLLPCIMNAVAPPSLADNHFYLYIFTRRNARQHNPLAPLSGFFSCCCCSHIYSVFSRLSVTLSFSSAAGKKKRRLQTRLRE